jgi:glycosyltransferase involved in cell wall biosynthesis
MRVGFVSVDDARDGKAWSGIPRAVLGELEAAGVEIVPVFPLRRDLRFLFLPQWVRAKRRGLTICADRHPIVLRSFARQVERELARHPVDVVFATSSVPITRLVCSQPVVFWTDAIWHAFQGYYPIRATAAADAWARKQEEMALRRATVAVYASNWAAEVARRYVGAEKVRVIHFGASVGATHAEGEVRAWARERVETAGKELKFLFVGVDWHRKGGDIAVDAVRILNQSGVRACLKVVGCSLPRPIPDFVEEVGFLDKSSAADRERLARIFRESHFFVLPTRAEAAGIVFCEASAYGLPIITYATGGVMDYVRRGTNGVALDPREGAAEFAATARQLISAPKEYEDLASSAFQEYKQRLNWKNAVGILRDIFDEATNTSAAKLVRR